MLRQTDPDLHSPYPHYPCPAVRMVSATPTMLHQYHLPTPTRLHTCAFPAPDYADLQYHLPLLKYDYNEQTFTSPGSYAAPISHTIALSMQLPCQP